jgi:hypothetical protein
MKKDSPFITDATECKHCGYEFGYYDKVTGVCQNCKNQDEFNKWASSFHAKINYIDNNFNKQTIIFTDYWKMDNWLCKGDFLKLTYSNIQGVTQKYI